jgi:pimeloyl-ACP methyl ester carboxylesterase
METIKRILLVLTITALTLTVQTAPGLADNSPPSTDQVIDGSFGPGALYRLVRPANWNGELVVYAHGYVSPDQPVALTPDDLLVISLLAPQGFAIAVSSFSENGWNVKDGTQRTHQLLGIFTSRFGPPTSVYVTGASMGGLIAIKLAETYPDTYAGALAASAVSAGLRGEFDYQANTRALFDFFYPGVLPGSAAYLPPGTEITTGIVEPAIAAITVNPVPALTMALIDQTPLPGTNASEVIESIVTALSFNAGSLAELRTLTKGKPYFDNRNTSYSSALLPPPLLQAINAGVGRFAATPSALHALDHNYTPSGDLRIPMLMLSDARDPVVPGFNQDSYLAAVVAHGAGNLLVQRQVPVYGHAVFTPAELTTAFSDLVLWVRYGIKPTP